MIEKVKKSILCSMKSNIIIPLLMLVFGFFLLRESYLYFNDRIIKFQIVVFVWCSIHFFNVIRNLMINYKKLYNKHEASEELKSIIINSNPCGIVILDKVGVIEFINPAAKDILGSDSIIGLNILDFETTKNNELHKAIYEGIHGKAIKVLEYNMYTTRENKVVNVNIHPVFEKNNNAVRKIILIVNDVTEEATLKNEVEATNISTLTALAHLVDARDDYTGRHSGNVTRYTEILCDCLNLREEEREKIITSAKLHDIGKIGIDDSILKKPGSLSASEYSKMKLHCTIGAGIIGDINGFEEVAKIIKHHHERYDGSGYPEGIKGEEIPLGSQIIAIADAFDAITTNRVYRNSLGYHNAVRILNEEKGKQFNSLLVDMFLKKVKEIHIDNELENVG